MAGKTVLTGVQATGMPHLGNYIGAIRPALEKAAQEEKSFLFIADYHALNSVHDAVALKRDTYEVAACWLALGLDPARTIFYRQSDIPEIMELTTILCAVTPKGLMDRSHAYKASVDRNKADGNDADLNVNMGLYTYPLLMAADILSMRADLVPVGHDQTQHIEFARDMAGYFNNAYKSVLVPPTGLIQAQSATVPGLDGRKMSKSYNNHVPLFADAKARQKLIMKIITDSKLPNEAKDPADSTIYKLYAYFAADAERQAMHDAFTGGQMGYGDAKKLLAEAVEKSLEKPSQIYQSYMADLPKLDAVLEEGADRARKVARNTLSDVREAIGVKRLK
ncbi:MAG: tryptophan--tRNA ligase [Micavibrio sp.]|nr:tryptophan--tRNA ligase [Micavibrio sp.]